MTGQQRHHRLPRGVRGTLSLRRRAGFRSARGSVRSAQRAHSEHRRAAHGATNRGSSLTFRLFAFRFQDVLRGTCEPRIDLCGFRGCCPCQPSRAMRAKAAAPKPEWRRRANGSRATARQASQPSRFLQSEADCCAQSIHLHPRESGDPEATRARACGPGSRLSPG